MPEFRRTVCYEDYETEVEVTTTAYCSPEWDEDFHVSTYEFFHACDNDDRMEFVQYCIRNGLRDDIIEELGNPDIPIPIPIPIPITRTETFVPSPGVELDVLIDQMTDDMILGSPDATLDRLRALLA